MIQQSFVQHQLGRHPRQKQGQQNEAKLDLVPKAGSDQKGLEPQLCACSAVSHLGAPGRDGGDQGALPGGGDIRVSQVEQKLATWKVKDSKE